MGEPAVRFGDAVVGAAVDVGVAVATGGGVQAASARTSSTLLTSR